MVVLTGGVDGYFIARRPGRSGGLGARRTGRRRSASLAPGVGDARVHAAAAVAAIDGQAWGGGCETALACAAARQPSGPHSASPRSPSASSPAPAERNASRGSSGRRSAPSLPVRTGPSGRRSAPGRPPERGAADRRLPRPRSRVVRSDREQPRQRGVRREAAVVDGLRLPLDEGLRLEARLFREVNASADARAANVAVPGRSSSARSLAAPNRQKFKKRFTAE